MFSFIIVTFNSNTFIRGCLDSVFSQECHDFEVIIVDNASKDGTVELIKKHYSRVTLIKNEENLGAARARNQGIEIAKGGWVIVLDCDVVLERDFILQALQALKEIPDEIGMLQPKILSADKTRIFSSGISVSFLKRFYDIGKGIRDGDKFSIPKHVFGVCSAAAIYKRQMLEELKDITGYFDERFFFLFEDVDLSWRAQDKGWKALYSPRLRCCHQGNSSQTSIAMRQYFCWRNRELILEKHKLNKFELLLSLICYDLPRAIYLSFVNPYYLAGMKKAISHL